MNIRVLAPGITGMDLAKRVKGKFAPKITREEWLNRRGVWYTIEPNGCWQWHRAFSGGSPNRSGYGIISNRGKRFYAHRLSYELLRRKIPPDLCIDHICRNRACVNPDHMELVTPGYNVLIGKSPSAINLGASHCSNGHEYTPTTTYVGPNGWRRCRICIRAAQNRRLQAAARECSDS